MRWLLVGAWTLFFVALAFEGSVRLFRLQSVPYFHPDVWLGWRHIPNQKGWYVSANARAPIRTSSHGLMGPERGYAKPPGKKRILLLGDSFTEAAQVPYDDSFGARLERKLGPDWEVLNAGVAGYGTDNELLFLRREGFRYQPDLVFVLFFGGNDVADNDSLLSYETGLSLPKPYFTLDGDGLRLHDFPLPPRPSGIAASAKEFLARHSLAYTLVRDTFYRRRALHRQTSTGPDPVPISWRVYRRHVDADWERAWAVTGALLVDMQKETAARNTGFAVGFMPTAWRIDAAEHQRIVRKYPELADTSVWDFDLPERRLQEALSRSGIPYISFTPALTRAAGHGAEMFRDHLSRQGHEVIADTLARWLATPE